MRTTVTIGLGLAQAAGAALLAVLAWQLPAGDETPDIPSAVTPAAPNPAARPEPPQPLVQLLLEQMLTADNVRQLRDSLTATADGLTALAGTLDTDLAKKTGAGLGEAADYLDRQVIPTAEAAARELEEAGTRLQGDARKLAERLRGAQLDLDRVREVDEALGRFAEGMRAMDRVLALPQLAELRKGLQGADTALAGLADTAENVASKTYPVVNMDGWKPVINYKPFWPEGHQVAKGLRDTDAGVRAADKQLAQLPKEMEKVRAALTASREVVEKSRGALTKVLQDREKLEPLLKSLPETAARLAEDLPRLTATVARALRDTGRLKEIAGGLRATQGQVDRAVAAWPGVQRMLQSTAQALRSNRQRLDLAVTVYAAWKKKAELLPAAPADTPAAAPQLTAPPGRVAGVDPGRNFTLIRWVLLGLAGLVGLQGLWQAAGRVRSPA